MHTEYPQPGSSSFEEGTSQDYEGDSTFSPFLHVLLLFQRAPQNSRKLEILGLR